MSFYKREMLIDGRDRGETFTPEDYINFIAPGYSKYTKYDYDPCTGKYTFIVEK